MPPMSAARLKTWSTSVQTFLQLSKRRRSTRWNSSQKMSSCDIVGIDKVRTRSVCRHAAHQVEQNKPTYREMLIPLPVAGNHVMAFRLETLGQVGSNETSSTSDAYTQLLLRPIRLERVLCQTRSLSIVLVDTGMVSSHSYDLLS